jgi:hypothetical protein
LKESQLASSLDHYRICRLVTPSANTILRPAVRANFLIPHFHFQRGYCRGDEVELPDRAYELAESGVFENPVDKEDREEIAEYQPGRPPGRTPEIEQFISEEDQNEEGYRKPFIA